MKTRNAQISHEQPLNESGKEHAKRVRSLRCMRPVAIVSITLIVIAGFVYAWASLSIHNSLLARGILWGDSDTGDLHRFTQRPVQAAAQPFKFKTVEQLTFPDPQVTDQGTDYSLEEYLAGSDTTAFIILHHDKLVYERYFNGAGRETALTYFSTTKSFLSTLLGIAIEEGAVASLDDPVTRYIPELLEQDARFAEITLKHLVAMSSGLKFENRENGIDDGMITYYSVDLRSAALQSEIVDRPGTRFVYNDYNPLLLGIVLERATGMTVSEYLQTRLWQPMGAEGAASWSLDSEQYGFELMAAGLNGRAIDLAKLGYLFLNQGSIEGRQIVPAAWVEEATRSDSSVNQSERYQYFWWRDNEINAYFAEGDHCQYMYVVPESGLVIVRTGNGCGDAPNFGPDFLRNFAAYLAQIVDSK